MEDKQRYDVAKLLSSFTNFHV